MFLPVNYLIIEALERYDFFFGPNFKVECPTGSGNMMRLKDCAKEISTRLASIFLPDENGVRPCHADNLLYKDDPAFKDLVLFYEYFHGDTARGCGARYVQPNILPHVIFISRHLFPFQQRIKTTFTEDSKRRIGNGGIFRQAKACGRHCPDKQKQKN